MGSASDVLTVASSQGVIVVKSQPSLGQSITVSSLCLTRDVLEESRKVLLAEMNSVDCVVPAVR